MGQADELFGFAAGTPGRPRHAGDTCHAGDTRHARHARHAGRGDGDGQPFGIEAGTQGGKTGRRSVQDSGWPLRGCGVAGWGPAMWSSGYVRGAFEGQVLFPFCRFMMDTPFFIIRFPKNSEGALLRDILMPQGDLLNRYGGSYQVFLLLLQVRTL